MAEAEFTFLDDRKMSGMKRVNTFESRIQRRDPLRKARKRLVSKILHACSIPFQEYDDTYNIMEGAIIRISDKLARGKNPCLTSPHRANQDLYNAFIDLGVPRTPGNDLREQFSIIAAEILNTYLKDYDHRRFLHGSGLPANIRRNLAETNFQLKEVSTGGFQA